MLAFFIVIILPLLEIIGFIVIGGEIGLGKSLLWLALSTFAGFYLLATMGASTLKKAQKSIEADIYPFEEMFDGFCIVIGSVLLIFPGFISDFLAIPLMLPPVRRLIFWFLKSRHESVLDGFSQKAEGFSSWYSEKKNPLPDSTIIEGEFTVIDKKNNDEN